MTTHTPNHDGSHSPMDVPFAKVEKALLISALWEETASRFRKRASIRIPCDESTFPVSSSFD